MTFGGMALRMADGNWLSLNIQVVRPLKIHHRFDKRCNVVSIVLVTRQRGGACHCVNGSYVFPWNTCITLTPVDPEPLNRSIDYVGKISEQTKNALIWTNVGLGIHA